MYVVRKGDFCDFFFWSALIHRNHPDQGIGKKRQLEDLGINPYIHAEAFAPWLSLGTISLSALTLPAAAFPGRTAKRPLETFYHAFPLL